MKKIFVFMIGLAFTGFLGAQEVASFAFTFNHMALSVKDVDRSAEFYKNILKLQEITNRTKMQGIRWFSMGEGKELHLISGQAGNVTINKAVHLALTTPDFDAFARMLDASGIAFSDWPGSAHTINKRADGIKQIYFQDPDGYWIEVNNTVER